MAIPSLQEALSFSRRLNEGQSFQDIEIDLVERVTNDLNALTNELTIFQRNRIDRVTRLVNSLREIISSNAQVTSENLENLQRISQRVQVVLDDLSQETQKTSLILEKQKASKEDSCQIFENSCQTLKRLPKGSLIDEIANTAGTIAVHIIEPKVPMHKRGRKI